MRLFIELIKANIKNMNVYIMSSITALLGQILQVVILMIFWTYIYGADIHLLRYVVWSRVLYYFVGENCIWELSGKIKDGNMIVDMIKPIGYFQYKFLQNMASRVAKLVYIGIPLLIIIYIIIPIHFTYIQVFLCVISVVLSGIISFSFDYAMSLISIYTQNTWGVSSLRDGLFQIFSGSLIPIRLYRHFWVNITYCLPFAYIIDIPTNVLLGEIRYYQMLYQVLYAIFMVFFVHVIQKKLWNKLQIQGG